MPSNEKIKNLERVITSLVTSFTRDGLIDPLGKTSDEIMSEMLGLFDIYEFFPIIDHTQGILSAAREYNRTSQPYFSCLFYALWIEHTLNRLNF